jgi:hypothetical protein
MRPKRSAIKIVRQISDEKKAVFGPPFLMPGKKQDGVFLFGAVSSETAFLRSAFVA